MDEEEGEEERSRRKSDNLLHTDGGQHVKNAPEILPGVPPDHTDVPGLEDRNP